MKKNKLKVFAQGNKNKIESLGGRGKKTKRASYTG